jgi:hypothetical protein
MWVTCIVMSKKVEGLQSTYSAVRHEGRNKGLITLSMFVYVVDSQIELLETNFAD